MALAVVVPTFQEQATIEPLVREIVLTLDALLVSYEVIVVDDESDDGTAEIVRRLCAELPRLRIIERKGERGLSGAILDGWRSSSAPVLGVIDADFQHPPELLAQLWAAVSQGADIAVASRYACGATVGNWRWLRLLVSASATVLCRPLQRKSCRVLDPMSGFFLLRREVLQAVARPQRSGFKLLLELLVRARFDSVREVPFRFGKRRGGESKASIAVFGDYAILLAQLYRERMREAQFRRRENKKRSEAPPAPQQAFQQAIPREDHPR